jgi:hypothetical protein
MLRRTPRRPLTILVPVIGGVQSVLTRTFNFRLDGQIDATTASSPRLRARWLRCIRSVSRVFAFFIARRQAAS